jgi:hypothetical protein
VTTADDDGAGEEESPCFSGGACSASRRFQVRQYVARGPSGSTSGAALPPSDDLKIVLATDQEATRTS